MFSSALALVAVALLPLLSQGQDQSQRYGPSQPDDFSAEQWLAHLKKIDAAGRLSNGASVPWDFKLSGSVWFAEGEIGLAARQREALAQKMDSFQNMRSPYREAYCTLALHITGPHIQDAATQRLVRQRVAAVRQWFVVHGYDATLVRANTWGGYDIKEVQWEFEGGLLSKTKCETERAEARKDLAAQYARDDPSLVR